MCALFIYHSCIRKLHSSRTAGDASHARLTWKTFEKYVATRANMCVCVCVYIYIYIYIYIMRWHACIRINFMQTQRTCVCHGSSYILSSHPFISHAHMLDLMHTRAHIFLIWWSRTQNCRTWSWNACMHVTEPDPQTNMNTNLQLAARGSAQTAALAASAVTTASITVSAETIFAITLITMFGVAIAGGVFAALWYWFTATQPLDRFKAFVSATAAPMYLYMFWFLLACVCTTCWYNVAYFYLINLPTFVEYHVLYVRYECCQRYFPCHVNAH